jgi:hypothetical protein
MSAKQIGSLSSFLSWERVENRINLEDQFHGGREKPQTVKCKKVILHGSLAKTSNSSPLNRKVKDRSSQFPNHN